MQLFCKATVATIVLIAGSTIGGGTLALPAAAAPAGFIPASTALVGCWLFLFVEALLLVEVSVRIPRVVLRRACLGARKCLHQQLAGCIQRKLRIVTSRDSHQEIAHTTPAEFPLHGGTPYQGLHARRWGLGFVHHSRAIFCRAVPNPHSHDSQPLLHRL